MTIVVGLDTASTRWHAVTSQGDEGGIDLHPTRKPWKDATPDERRAELAEQFGRFLIGFPTQPEIFCEEPLALKNGKTTRLLSLAAGALWEVGRQHGVIWHWVDVAHWKRIVIGNGNADKAAIQMAVTLNYGVSYDVEDLYDAHALMVYGRDHRDAPKLHA